MTQQIFDGTLFPGGLGARFPRIGRVMPSYCYANGIITDALPDRALMEQHVAMHVVQYNKGAMPAVVYVEEFADAAWNWGSGNDQKMMDLRSGFLRTLRQVVGPDVKLMFWGWPVGGIMQARNYLRSDLFDAWVKPVVYAASRCRLDVFSSGAQSAELMKHMDGVGLSLYWDTGTAQNTGLNEATAYWSCCEPMLQVAAGVGKEVFSFVRIMSLTGQPAPAEVVNLYWKLPNLVIWEDFGWNAKGPPVDVPGMKLYGRH